MAAKALFLRNIDFHKAADARYQERKKKEAEAEHLRSTMEEKNRTKEKMMEENNKKKEIEKKQHAKKEKIDRTNQQKENECCVCLNTYSDEEIQSSKSKVSMPCTNHHTCYGCYLTIYKGRLPQCPICRHSFFEPDKMRERAITAGHFEPDPYLFDPTIFNGNLFPDLEDPQWPPTVLGTPTWGNAIPIPRARIPSLWGRGSLLPRNTTPSLWGSGSHLSRNRTPSLWVSSGSHHSCNNRP